MERIHRDGNTEVGMVNIALLKHPLFWPPLWVCVGILEFCELSVEDFPCHNQLPKPSLFRKSLCWWRLRGWATTRQQKWLVNCNPQGLEQQSHCSEPVPSKFPKLLVLCQVGSVCFLSHTYLISRPWVKQWQTHGEQLILQLSLIGSNACRNAGSSAPPFFQKRLQFSVTPPLYRMACVGGVRSLTLKCVESKVKQHTHTHTVLKRNLRPCQFDLIMKT